MRAAVVFNGKTGSGFDIAQNPALALGDGLIAELLHRDFVAPFAESALSELLDVALVHQGDGLASCFERGADGVAYQALGAKDGDRLDAHSGVIADLLLAALEQVVVEEVDETGGVRAALLELDARIHILGVFAEDDDVQLLGMLHRAGHALVVLDRPDAGVEVQQLAQGHVERANAAANRRSQRPLDGDAQVAGGGHRVVGQPGAELPEGLFAGEDLEPADGALAAVGLLYRGVEDALRGLPDIAARAVPLNKGDDGMAGHLELPAFITDRLTVLGKRQAVIGGLHGFLGNPFQCANLSKRLPPPNRGAQWQGWALGWEGPRKARGRLLQCPGKGLPEWAAIQARPQPRTWGVSKERP